MVQKQSELMSWIVGNVGPVSGWTSSLCSQRRRMRRRMLRRMQQICAFQFQETMTNQETTHHHCLFENQTRNHWATTLNPPCMLPIALTLEKITNASNSATLCDPTILQCPIQHCAAVSSLQVACRCCLKQKLCCQLSQRNKWNKQHIQWQCCKC